MLYYQLCIKLTNAIYQTKANKFLSSLCEAHVGIELLNSERFLGSHTLL